MGETVGCRAGKDETFSLRLRNVPVGIDFILLTEAEEEGQREEYPNGESRRSVRLLVRTRFLSYHWLAASYHDSPTAGASGDVLSTGPNNQLVVTAIQK